MNLLACFKAVPCWERVLPADWEGFAPGTDLAYAGSEINCFDEAALELALRLKAQAAEQGLPARCTAVTAGVTPPAHLVEGLYAAGFDEVVALETGPLEFAPVEAARLLALFAQAQQADLVLTGVQSGMADTGLVPHLLAGRLGLPHLAEAEDLALSGGGLLVTQRDAAGLWQREAALPLVVSVGNSPAVLRAVSLRTRLAAKGRRATAQAVPSVATPVPKLLCPQNTRACHFLQADEPQGQAEALLAGPLLAREEYPTQAGTEGSAPQNALPTRFDAVAMDVAGSTMPLPAEALQHAFAAWQARKPALLLLPDNAPGRQLAAFLANAGGAYPFTGCHLAREGNALLLEKNACAANLRWRVDVARPTVATLAGPLPPDVERLAYRAPCGPPTWLRGQTLLEPPAENGLQNRRLVVVCGVGMGSRVNCCAARTLAARLGAGFGLTRPAALNGWGSAAEIVGQSGGSIAPAACLVLGASGAGAFMAGIEGAGQVVAVNRDPAALVFRGANHGLVADAPALVTAMLAALAP